MSIPQSDRTLSDFVVSLLRTVVPVAWGALITYLVGLVPALTGFVDPGTLASWGVPITAAVIAAWYVVMRKVEPYLPGWLTALVLGSNATPKYGLGPSARFMSAMEGQLQAAAEALSRPDAPQIKPPSTDA